MNIGGLWYGGQSGDFLVVIVMILVIAVVSIDDYNV